MTQLESSRLTICNSHLADGKGRGSNRRRCYQPWPQRSNINARLYQCRDLHRFHRDYVSRSAYRALLKPGRESAAQGQDIGRRPQASNLGCRIQGRPQANCDTPGPSSSAILLHQLLLQRFLEYLVDHLLHRSRTSILILLHQLRGCLLFFHDRSTS